MEHCSLLHYDFLFALLASCPFLETLHFLCCHNRYMSKLHIHSASIKHLVVLYKTPIFRPIDVHCPKLESLTVNTSYTTALHIEAPKILAAEHEFDRFIYPEIKEDDVIFNFDFNLKDQSSSMILTQLLKVYNDYNSEFDIRVDSTRIQSTNETTRDDQLLHGSTDIELIKLQMRMPKKTFEGFLSNLEKMEKLKQVGLQKLKSRTSTEQFNDILASNEPLVEVSSSITKCIEMKF